MKYKNIFILTGAGISAESGLATFRGADGLWNNHKVEDVATIEAYQRDPDKVLAFYNELRKAIEGAEPNAAHKAITRLQDDCSATVNVITQNVDLLHEKAGNKNVYHMHGRINRYICMCCGEIIETTDDVTGETCCPICGIMGQMKPHIVFFGETPLHLKEIEKMLGECDLFLSIGTSGVVYPAAGFVKGAKQAGANCCEFTLDRTENNALFYRCVMGKAGETFPAYVEELLKS